MPGIILYVLDVERVARFYSQILEGHITRKDDEYAIVDSQESQIVVIRTPEEIAVEISISPRPVRRTDVAIKLWFSVTSIGDARTIAEKLGGGLNPPDKEWDFEGARVCDAFDPEGNVFQLRERAS